MTKLLSCFIAPKFEGKVFLCSSKQKGWCLDQMFDFAKDKGDATLFFRRCFETRTEKLYPKYNVRKRLDLLNTMLPILANTIESLREQLANPERREQVRHARSGVEVFLDMFDDESVFSSTIVRDNLERLDRDLLNCPFDDELEERDYYYWEVVDEPTLFESHWWWWNKNQLL